eukprot:UN26067
MIPFSNELSVLEMRLYELSEYVHRFVIFESPINHHYYRKPLFFSRNTKRFEMFNKKIIHFVDDEIQEFYKDKISNGADWKLETRMRQVLWEKYLRYHDKMMKTFDTSRLLFIHGDPDEIPSRDLVAHLKYCER